MRRLTAGPAPCTWTARAAWRTRCRRCSMTSCVEFEERMPSADARSRLETLLAAARKPLLLVGLGARRPADAAAIRSLCAGRHIPAMVTYKAKGVVPDDHPWFAGVFTNADDRAAGDRRVRSVDRDGTRSRRAHPARMEARAAHRLLRPVAGRGRARSVCDAIRYRCPDRSKRGRGAARRHRTGTAGSRAPASRRAAPADRRARPTDCRLNASCRSPRRGWPPPPDA